MEGSSYPNPENNRPAALPASPAADAFLPTRWGEFRVRAYEGSDGREYGVLIRGEVEGAEEVPVRLHSECFTGDVMGSLRCDCRDQLEAALAWVAEAGRGVIVYLPQEGRGIGLANKIRAYALQDQGMDTVEANLALGFPDDLRRYDVAASILAGIGARSWVLLTNNPNKIQALCASGLDVARQQPLRMAPNPHNARYLQTKRVKSGHMI